MARPGRSVRAGIFAAIVAWHALVVLMLMQQRVVRVMEPEFVTTWLRLDPPPRQPPSPPPLRAPLLTPAPVTPPVATDTPPAPSPSPDTAITTPKVDWFGQASRAARDQYAKRLPTPRSLDDEPEAMQLPPSGPPAHKFGDTEPLPGGEWRMWVNERCWTIITNGEPPPLPGQLKPMSVTCPLGRPAVIDAAVIESRKPSYLLERPVTLPPKDRRIRPGQTRTGPSMGGAPDP